MTELNCQMLLFIYRDESQLLLFLHAIMSVLPDDITIAAANQTCHMRVAVDNVTAAMRSQMTYCRQGLQSLIVNAECDPESQPTSVPLPNQGQDKSVTSMRQDKSVTSMRQDKSVTSMREQFASLQQRVQRRAEGKCGGKVLEVFRQEVKRLGKDTDAAMAELTASHDNL